MPSTTEWLLFPINHVYNQHQDYIFKAYASYTTCRTCRPMSRFIGQCVVNVKLAELLPIRVPAFHYITDRLNHFPCKYFIPLVLSLPATHASIDDNFMIVRNYSIECTPCLLLYKWLPCFKVASKLVSSVTTLEELAWWLETIRRQRLAYFSKLSSIMILHNLQYTANLKCGCWYHWNCNEECRMMQFIW